MSNEILTYLHDGIELTGEDWTNSTHSFGDLVHVIGSTHDAAQTAAVKAINRMQTMRNWLIGYYIVEFEQHGKDRAEYGSHLLKRLEESVNRKGLTVTLFKWARKFYQLYPQMAENFVLPNYATLSANSLNQIGASLSHQLQTSEIQNVEKGASLMHQFVTPGDRIISRLSFTHLREIMTVDDPLARYFYEQECIRCTWSVRELRRQISTNLFVRAGISSNPEKMLSMPKMQGSDSNELQIRSPFTFEFLGLKAKEIVYEHDIEDALMDHLQEFLLELGKRKANGRICPSRYGQPTLCLHLYASVA